MSGPDAGAADPPGLDTARLRAWLETNAPQVAGEEPTATLIAGGRSNLTYLVRSGKHRLVVRRPPLGHVLATAHDMAREHRVIRALQDTDVPVPATYGLCEDEDVIGAPFYVMEHVAGTPYRRAEELAALGAERTTAIARRLVETLASLHAVDPDAVGLGDFGRPEGYLQRQVRRWKKQLDASRSREVAGIDELHERLSAAEPTPSAPAVVHGDYRLDNVLVDDRDRVVAVLDWEMATLGDPLTDVALLAVYQRSSDLADSGVVSTVTLAPGWPSEQELLEHYATLSGRDLTDLHFHVALAAFKLAVILEGIHYRHTQGQTVGEGFDRIGRVVEPLAAIGLDAIKEQS